MVFEDLEIERPPWSKMEEGQRASAGGRHGDDGSHSAAALECKGGGHKPRNASRLGKPGQVRKRMLPQSLQMAGSLGGTTAVQPRLTPPTQGPGSRGYPNLRSQSELTPNSHLAAVCWGQVNLSLSASSSVKWACGQPTLEGTGDMKQLTAKCCMMLPTITALPSHCHCVLQSGWELLVPTTSETLARPPEVRSSLSLRSDPRSGSCHHRWG